jgi:DNA-binding transcriptional LysR family regulator
VNVRQLEALLWVVRLGSFAAAATQMNATQSTISMRIQELEQELGVLLFDRTHRKAHLSAKGRELLSYAEEAVALFSEIRHRVGARDALTGVARVGVAELVAVTWLPQLVATMHRDYPGLTLELDVSLTANLFTGLQNGDLDVVLIPGGRFDDNLVVHSLGLVSFAWMASPKLALPDRPLTPADLRQWPILSLGEGSYHHGPAEAWLAAHGGRRRHVDVCNSMSVIASLTAAGLGISLLPPSCYAAEIDHGRLRVLDTRPPMREVEFSAVYRKRRPGVIPELISMASRQASTFQHRRPKPRAARQTSAN